MFNTIPLNDPPEATWSNLAAIEPVSGLSQAAKTNEQDLFPFSKCQRPCPPDSIWNSTGNFEKLALSQIKQYINQSDNGVLPPPDWWALSRVFITKSGRYWCDAFDSAHSSRDFFRPDKEEGVLHEAERSVFQITSGRRKRRRSEGGRRPPIGRITDTFPQCLNHSLGLSTFLFIQLLVVQQVHCNLASNVTDWSWVHNRLLVLVVLGFFPIWRGEKREIGGSLCRIWCFLVAFRSQNGVPDFSLALYLSGYRDESRIHTIFVGIN